MADEETTVVQVGGVLRPVTITSDADGFTVRCPSVLGATAVGEDREEALARIPQVIAMVLAARGR
jgi:predicted RNase H-like HicB family nuclease